jgi:formylglycine-generating enzyme required for sulfatase activity
MGIDDRNQYDWFRSLPFGGLEQLSNVVQVLREQYNVQVMLPYNPWDVGTRREPVADPEAMAQLLKNTSAVGFNGDTMVDIPEAFFTAALSAGLPGVVLQPENGGLPDSMNWTSMAWGYWSYPPDQPCVDADRWVARRRMTGVCERWAQDKTDNIHSAYVNGVGYVPWENVWGTWNGITPQGGELIRRYATILRWVQPSLRLNGESWRPLLTPYCLASHVFASSWDVNSTDDVSDPTLYLAGIRRVYLLVNRGNESVDTHSPMLNLTVAPDTLGGWASSGPLYIIDCYHGTLLTEWSWTRQSQWLVINGSIGPRDLGCVAVATTSPFDNESQQLSGEWREFLANMQNLTATPLSSYSNVWYPLPQTMMDPQSPHRSTHPAAQASHEGMLKIPGTSDYTFTSSGIEIEGPPDRGVDFQFPWETYPSRHHGPVNLTMPTFYMDEVLVTMVEYEVYLNTSGYVPADDNNFLRKWTKWHSSPPRWVHPAGGSRSPVTWISLDEAAMYCAYYGKRLPRPFEWQYAAQGSTGDRTPWAQNESKYCIPPTSSASEMPLPPMRRGQ